MNAPAKTARNLDVATPGEVPPAPDTILAAAENGAIEKPTKAKERVRVSQDYRTMRAADVDATALTSPVLTLDGYVCPAPVDKK